MSKRSHKTLSIKIKQQIINSVKNGERKKDVAAKYEIAPSTLTSILKQSETYMAISSNSIKKEQNMRVSGIRGSFKIVVATMCPESNTSWWSYSARKGKENSSATWNSQLQLQ